MFGLFGKKKAGVFDHWYTLVPSFNTSTKEFYAAVEGELKARHVPGLDVSYITFTEGGILSAKREYLRMTRERLVFDVCAAPFGNSYFFSCRFGEIAAAINIAHLLAIAVGVGIVAYLLYLICSLFFGWLTPYVWPVASIGFVALAGYILRNSIALGLKDLDAAILKIPGINTVYETWIRKETYYRQDTRLMYHDTVNAVVKAKLEELTGAKGIKLVRYNECSPLIGELYKQKTVGLEPQTA